MKHVDREQCDGEDGLCTKALKGCCVFIGSLSILSEDRRSACMMRSLHVDCYSGTTKRSFADEYVFQ